MEVSGIRYWITDKVVNMMTCKILCDDKEIATFDCTADGCNIQFTDEGKDLCKDGSKGCC